MKSDDIVVQKLPDILAVARLAPSVHNTQPWSVIARGDAIEVTIDPKHALVDGDPTGRQTIISLGIFCEAICLAGEEHGLETTGINLRGRTAAIQLKQGKTDLPAAKRAIRLLQLRCTDRSLFRPISLSQQTIDTIRGIKQPDGVQVRIVTDQALLKRVAQLTSRGIRLALSNPSFRRELSRYLIVPWSRKTRGISTKSLYIAWPLAVLEPLFMRLGIGLKTEAWLEKKRWLSASGVVVILGDGDLPKYWLEAGRVYLRASLSIEAAGLSQATSAAIVEAADYHEDIEAALQTKQRILALIRIGQGRQVRYHSPRVAVADILT